MPVWLTEEIIFPQSLNADENGIVALGGDFSSSRLLLAYRSGIFPWPHQGLPILWFCPDPRFVLEPKRVVLNRKLKKSLLKTKLTIKADTDFLSVIKKCQQVHQERRDGTWIADEMIDGYYALFQQGWAHSIEAYDHDVLVGGLYGISVGGIFFGESMFFAIPNASKICFIMLVAHLLDWNFSLIDCQAYTDHLKSFGAHEIAREKFLSLININQHAPSKLGPWLLHLTPAMALEKINECIG